MSLGGGGEPGEMEIPLGKPRPVEMFRGESPGLRWCCWGPGGGGLACDGEGWLRGSTVAQVGTEKSSDEVEQWTAVSWWGDS